MFLFKGWINSQKSRRKTTTARGRLKQKWIKLLTKTQDSHCSANSDEEGAVQLQAETQNVLEEPWMLRIFIFLC